MTAASNAGGIKLTGARATIAARMRQSLAEAAQLSYFAEADVSDLLMRREEWKRGGKSIGIEDCVIAILAQSLRRFPEFNATLRDDLFAVADHVDVAVAISTSLGLMTPVIRNVEQLSLGQIAERRRDLVDRAKKGALKVSEMKDGTITISNLGLTRVRHFTPILNRPQVALLGIGRIEDTVKVLSDEFAACKVMNLSLTTDHRVLDGEPSGRFLESICKGLEDAPFGQ